MKKARGLFGARTICLALAAIATGACRSEAPADRVRVSGQVEATEVQVAPQVAGRILELKVAEGDHVTAGVVVARLDSADAELGLARARADREQALEAVDVGLGRGDLGFGGRRFGLSGGDLCFRLPHVLRP